MSNRETFEEIAEEVGGILRDDYSGRNMGGLTCFAIECDDPTECAVQARLRDVHGERMDRMGKRHIVYWPAKSASPRPGAKGG